jgi:hypothetical protein
MARPRYLPLGTLGLALLSSAPFPAAPRAQAPNALSSEEASLGFRLLFDGTRESFNRHFTDYAPEVAGAGPQDPRRLDSSWRLDSTLEAMVNEVPGCDLRSLRLYQDFELRFDYRGRGKSGLAYRHALTRDRAWRTGVEFILGTEDPAREGLVGGARSLFEPASGRFHEYLFGAGAWNTVRLVVVEDSVEHWLNGVKVLGYTYHSPRFWKAYAAGGWAAEDVLTFQDPGHRAAGPIRIGYLGIDVAEGGFLELRNLRVREIVTPPQPPPFVPPDTGSAAEGFVALYDGTREGFARSFVGYAQGTPPREPPLSDLWRVDTLTGAIRNREVTVDIRTRSTFRDFDLRMVYRCDGNSGIFYRHLLTRTRAWGTGLEYALDDGPEDGSVRSTGAVQGIFPPAGGFYLPYRTGRWNLARIVAVGDSVEHWLNGFRVAAFRLHSPRFWRAFDKASGPLEREYLTFKSPGDRLGGWIEEGHIGIQGDHQGKLEIRSLRIKDLTPTAVRPGRARAKTGKRARVPAAPHLLPAGDRAWVRPDGRRE